MVAPPWMSHTTLRPEVIRGYRDAPPNTVAEKMPIYAREQVAHAWHVDPELRTLEVFRWERGWWVVAATYRDEAVVRAEPVDAIELALGALWRP